MKFTGIKNYLSLPRTTQMIFGFQDIFVDSWNQYLINLELIGANLNDFSGYNRTGILVSILSGNLISDKNEKIGTYNTGRPFSLNGWVDTNDLSYISSDEIVFVSTGCFNSGKLGSLSIVCPAGGSFISDISITTNPINYSFSIPSFIVDRSVTGTLLTQTALKTYGTHLTFSNSNEDLLTGESFTGFNYQNSGIDIKLQDNDDSYSDNKINGIIKIDALWGEESLRFSTYRNIPSNNNTVITGFNENFTGFSGIFDGVWSGSGFLPDTQTINSIALNYNIRKNDYLGNPMPKVVEFYSEVSSTGTVPILARYPTSFNLTTGGEYTYVPNVLCSGYYWVTEMDKSLDTILFSSGCTGNIGVTFPGPFTGGVSSGYLTTRALTFSGLYGTGIKTFRIVESFQLETTGKSYTKAPIFTVITGRYGSSCFDLPLVSGNSSWYRPCTGYGRLTPKADYLTGEVLYRTGMVGTPAIITGYIVTGFELTNPGSGYGTGIYQTGTVPFHYLPLLRFIRKTGDALTKDASGILNLKETGINLGQRWMIETGIAGTNLIRSSFGSIILNLSPSEEDITVRISCSGVDNTSTINSKFMITDQQDDGKIFIDNISYDKYYSTDPEFLKKKIDGQLEYSGGSDLSFILTQSELDIFYSGTDFINGNAELDLGDLEF